MREKFMAFVPEEKSVEIIMIWINLNIFCKVGNVKQFGNKKNSCQIWEVEGVRRRLRSQGKRQDEGKIIRSACWTHQIHIHFWRRGKKGITIVK